MHITYQLRPTPISHARALLAVMRKEWIIFRRYTGWVVAVFIWPVLLPMGYVFAAKALGGPDGSDLGAFERLTGTRDYVGFIVIGTLVWGWLNMTLWDVGFQLRAEQMRGTLESNWLAPVSRIALLMGGSITKLGVSLLFLSVTMLEFQLVFGVRVIQGNVPALLAILLLLVPSIYGVGIAFASLVIRFKEASAMVYLVRGIFMVLCGITFPTAVLPGWMQAAAGLLPLTYAIHAVRTASLANASWAALWPDLRALLVFAVLLPVAGYFAFSATERSARKTGALGQY